MSFYRGSMMIIIPIAMCRIRRTLRSMHGIGYLWRRHRTWIAMKGMFSWHWISIHFRGWNVRRRRTSAMCWWWYILRRSNILPRRWMDLVQVSLIWDNVISLIPTEISQVWKIGWIAFKSQTMDNPFQLSFIGTLFCGSSWSICLYLCNNGCLQVDLEWYQRDEDDKNMDAIA